MTCASCVARVEKSISKIEGVKSVSVNLATEKATFEIDTKLASLTQIEKAIEDAGYKIDFSLLNKKSANNTSQAELKSDFDKELKKDFFLAIILTIPIFILSMGMMWEEFHNLITVVP
ncbi:MAG: copper ion binding protein [Ignavibacteriales bacterium]|nr:copper ion binding protein [Ignavibacteriales bacterium]